MTVKPWTIWRCDLYGSRLHGCLACWIQRFLVTLLVFAPFGYEIYSALKGRLTWP